MLTDSPVATRLPAKDLERARRFYSEKLGLEPVEERPGGLCYRCGGEYFALFESAGAASGNHTQMGWEVADLETTVAALSARGVVFEEYDLPGLETVNGIAEIEGNYPSKGVGERAAWFRDSEGNLLGLGQAVRFDETSPVDTALPPLGDAFVSRTASVNRTTLHYVRGGSGPAVILLHGFPQDWSVFRRIMPRLARTFTVLAVDLRGIGGSTPVPNGYDAATLAEDIHQLASHLVLEKPYIAGHDNGGMVAYALARLHPQTPRGVMILDVPIPGLEPWEQVKADPVLWHFDFHQTPNAPERLIAGREAVYFREVFFNRLARNRDAISDQDLAHYVRSYASPDQLRAALEFYRAYSANERFNAAHRDQLDLPIVLAGGDDSLAPLNPTVARALGDHGWRNVSVEVIADSGHQVVDEQPAAVADLLERYAAR